MSKEPLFSTRRARPRRVRWYVWCDFHGEIHEARDVYQEGEPENCGGLNWRAVYVASADPAEFRDA